MKVYVIFRNEWDYDEENYSNDVFGVFTNKDDAEKIVMEYNEKEGYRIDNSRGFSVKGLSYYFQECETDKFYNIEE